MPAHGHTIRCIKLIQNDHVTYLISLVQGYANLPLVKPYLTKEMRHSSSDGVVTRYFMMRFKDLSGNVITYELVYNHIEGCMLRYEGPTHDFLTHVGISHPDYRKQDWTVTQPAFAELMSLFSGDAPKEKKPKEQPKLKMYNYTPK